MISLGSTVALYLAEIWGKIKSISIFAVQFIALIFTFSRAGIGVTIIMLSLFIVLYRRQMFSRVFKIVSIIFLAGIISVFIYILLPDFMLRGISGRIATGLNVRDQLWFPLLLSIADKPLTGVGFGVSQEVILLPRGFDLGAHNAHLAIISEIGVLGYFLLIFVWVNGMLLCFRLNNKTIQRKTKTAFLLIGVLLFGIFIHQFVEGSVFRFGARHLLWVYLLGCAVSLYNKKISH